MDVKRFHKVLLAIFLFGLFIMPFVFWPTAPIPYEIPRVWFVLRWIELLAILALLGMIFDIKTNKVDATIIVLIIMFVTVAIFSSLFGVNTSKSIWGNYYRGDGLVTLIHLASLSIILTLYTKRSWIIPIAKAVSIGAILIGLWTIFQGLQTYVLGYIVSPWGEAIAISFGNPNFLAGYLVVTLPFPALQFTTSKSRNEKWFWIVAMTIQISAILFTLSKAGVVGVVLFAIGYLIIAQKRIRKSLIIIPTLTLILIGALLANNYKQNYNPYTIVAESRERIFTKAILAWRKRPFLGYGWANFDHAFESITWPLKLDHDVYVDKAHSQILEVLTTTGAFGLMIYVTLIFLVAANLYKAKSLESKFLLLTLILYLIHSQMNITSIAEEVIFWMIVGLSAITWTGDTPSKESGE